MVSLSGREHKQARSRTEGRERSMADINLTRRAFIGATGAASLVLAACGGAAGTDSGGDAAATDTEAAASGVITGTFDMHVQGYDYGAGVDKVTITLDAPLDAVAPENFSVVEHKQATDWTAEDFPVIEADFPREITAASIDGTTLELELACDPNNGSPFLYTMATGFNTWCDPYQLNITLAEGAELTSGGTAVTEFTIDPEPAGKTTSGDAWTLDSYECADGTTFQYAAFDPAEESKNLFVWLHGAGEGGTENTDPLVTILANKVVALSEDAFQTTVGGAHVVAPQSPTMWMDIGDNTYISTENSEEVHSIYTEALEEFIDAYAEKVGAEKVVVGGCSNGGFMTLWMALHRPDRYAGVVPICEAIPDALITDEQIAGLVDLPMYFIWSEDDTTVNPEECELPTTKRIRKVKKAAKKANKTLHISTTNMVVDTSGQYFAVDEEGNVTDQPYQYNGHWSWIYFDNNECACNRDGLKAFDFVAECFA